MKLNKKFENGATEREFDSDVDFSLQLTEKSLEHIIESFDYHSRMASIHLKCGAKELNFNELLQGHVHLAASEVLKAVLHQLEDEEQHIKDWFVKEYMTKSAKNFSLLVRKINRF
ncbi:hypothetical protein M8W81_000854 [Salmonella enterica]|nr:hypothetical protein [Salmonella enterica]EJF6007456.1 hypothetical protein [Salmonella enterica]EJF6161036.1 hypothetical protein [Salmonella enterica]